MQKTNNYKIVVVALVMAIMASTLIVTVFAASNKTKSTQAMQGTNVGLYWDSDCTNATSQISWGNLIPGTTKTITIYLRNEVNTPLKLNLTTCNWDNLNASKIFTLCWDQEGQILYPKSTVAANLALTIPQDIGGIADFSFDTVINGIATG